MTPDDDAVYPRRELSTGGLIEAMDLRPGQPVSIIFSQLPMTPDVDPNMGLPRTTLQKLRGVTSSRLTS